MILKLRLEVRSISENLKDLLEINEMKRARYMGIPQIIEVVLYQKCSKNAPYVYLLPYSRIERGKTPKGKKPR